MRKRQATGELSLFRKISVSRSPYSFLSGKPVDTNDLRIYCHVLSKKQYPGFRLKEENIVLMTPVEHALWDQGTDAQRKKYRENNPKADWKKLRKLKETLLEQYKQQYPL